MKQLRGQLRDHPNQANPEAPGPRSGQPRSLCLEAIGELGLALLLRRRVDVHCGRGPLAVAVRMVGCQAAIRRGHEGVLALGTKTLLKTNQTRSTTF